MDDFVRETVELTASALRDLHQELMKSEQRNYEGVHGKIPPAELLRLLLQSPQFAWLRPVSRLMADIDELLDSGGLTEKDAAAVRYEVDRLLSEPSDFYSRYKEMLQKETSVAVNHGKLRHALTTLPEPREEWQDEIARARQEWPLRRKRIRGKPN